MVQFLRSHIRWVSLPILAAMLALMGVSLLSVRGAEQAAVRSTAQAAGVAVAAGKPAPTVNPFVLGVTQKQAKFCLVALAGFFVASVVPYERIGRSSYLWFVLTLALLALVLFLPSNRNTQRWINFGPLQFQPSELAKITFVMALAWYLRYRDTYRQWRGLIWPFVMMTVPAVLILKEPDLGTTLLLPPTLLLMLFMAGARLRHLAVILGLAALAIFAPVPQRPDHIADRDVLADRQALAYWQGSFRGQEYLLVPGAVAAIGHHHQLIRIVGWLGQNDPSLSSDVSLQLRRSVMTIGSGGLLGHEQESDSDFVLNMLPEDHTDFILAVIGGKWGFLGCIGVLAIYLVIFVCGSEIAAMTYEPFGRLLAVGVLALLWTQIFINAAMAMGLLPITGMTLPLISYGGSSMMINGIALGLLVNVGRRPKAATGRKPFEFGRDETRSLGPLFDG